MIKSNARIPLISFVLCVLVRSAVQADDAAIFFQTHPNPIDLEQRGDDILFANRQIGLVFRPARSTGSEQTSGFQLIRVYGIERRQDFLIGTEVDEFRDLFEIRMALDPYKRQKDEREKIKYGHFVILDQMAGDDPFIIGSDEAKE